MAGRVVMDRRKGSKKKRLLIAQTAFQRRDFDPLKRYAEVYWLDELDPQKLDELLPTIDFLFSHGWPRSLDADKISKMKNLKYFQAGNAGVNAIRFEMLDKGVVCCSNAGGYSDEVGEFAVGLMLAAAKKIVSFDRSLRAGTYQRGGFGSRYQGGLGSQVRALKGKTLGVIGYGGIGRSTARFSKPFGMKILAFGRRPVRERGVTSLQGKDGLLRLLRESDVVLMALPLTKKTKDIIGARELAAMKPEAIFVNVARGEVVEEQAMYEHLVKNPGFIYATDVWWPKDGAMENTSPDLPFFKLDNVVGTPHASGPNAIVTGSVAKNAVANLVRFCKGQPLKNVVDRSEYV